MSTISNGITLLVVCILVSSCAHFTEEPFESTQAIDHENLTPTTDRQRTATVVKSPLPTPKPMTAVLLPEEDQVVFTISNSEPWSGKEGDSRPDWRGWGAETFTVAQDGSFWIADTAVTPNRLLHYNPQGQRLQEISLGDLVVYTYDILVTQQSIWVLDIAAEKPKVVKLSLDGEFLSSIDIDEQIMSFEGDYIFNGVDKLKLGEEGQVILHGINGYTVFIDTTGSVVARPLDALTFYGHTYQVGRYDDTSGKIPVLVDQTPLKTALDFYIVTPAFLGFNPDGSFALTGYLQSEPNEFQVDLVNYYTAAGELIATARQRPQTFYKDFNHHLALGPDGAVYQLLSNPDHSVQILRLGFSENLPTSSGLVQATPTPLSPLPPSESAETDEEQARNTLINFFADLSSGNYAAAAGLFGGELDGYLRDQLPEESLEDYWEYLCQYLWCLPVSEITATEQVAEEEYLFYVVFLHPDGRRFEMGACCGADPAASPPVWQFAYPVGLVEGKWKVLRAPLFTP